MHKAGMQEQIGYQLVKMEVAGQKEMQTTYICKVDTTQLENEGGYECDQVYDQQVFGDRGYAEHHRYFSLFDYLLKKD
jgi:hypothetical protein